MKTILLGTGDMTLRVLEEMLKDSRIDFMGVINDSSISESQIVYYNDKIEEMGGKILEYNEEVFASADIIFSCEYRKRIPLEFVKRYKFVNCHGGILPKYRGSSANAWAIMNGETEVGYTIHFMDERLDNGDILYVGRFPILEEQTYADVYEEIFGDMVSRICDVLVDSYTQKIVPIKQNSYGVYCSRFYPNLGDLRDFEKTSKDIYNLYRCMAKPHGSGVYFIHKEKKYYIGKMQLGKEFGIENYVGIPGKVVNCEGDSIWVKTQDNIVILSEIRNESGERIEDGHFIIGNKFGK